MTVYERLAAGFDVTFTDVRGGVEITFVSGEQVVSRLNEVLGPSGWSFSVIQHEVHAEADEIWVLGKLSAFIDGVWVEREQFGSQKIKRSRSTGAPLDIGFDLKGASTDAMKKCASWIGVALYLSRKATPAAKSGQRQKPAQAVRPVRAVQPDRVEPKVTPIKCKFVDGNGVVCDAVLENVADSGRLWSPADLANHSFKEFRKSLCWKHYEQALLQAARAG